MNSINKSLMCKSTRIIYRGIILIPVTADLINNIEILHANKYITKRKQINVNISHIRTRYSISEIV